MPRRTRLRTALAAGLLVAPLVAVPVAPALAATTADQGPDGYVPDGGPESALGTYGAYGGFGYDGGYDGGYGALPGSPYADSGTTTVDAQPATATESTGVVLVETEIDYGTGEAAGTGLVLDSDGIVVTNHHVVQGATAIQVSVPGTGTTYTADVLGYDATHDVAVLRLRGASGLATISTDASTPTTGEQVTAVGNAEGAGALTAADGTVISPSTAITVQEDDGSAARLTGLIQVSSDVVSGDSGGALLDADGQVIGMNVAATSGTADIDGYAIPISRVLAIADQILAGKEDAEVSIGYEAALGVELDGSATTTVAGVVDGGAAAEAGITAGSTITSLDGATVSTLSDITGVLAAHRPGDVVTVTWADRAGVSHDAKATLGRAPLA